MTKSYEELIVEQYNKFAELYEEAVTMSGATTSVETGFAAFMCNSIALGVSKSSQKELKAYFYKHASRE